jgi:phosphoribosylformylglycinamidine (FGAM) synthase PurS component
MVGQTTTREALEMKRTYQVIMTKVYEVKVEAESREQAEEIFDNFGDWEELLRVHALDIEPADYLTLREED